MCQNYPQHRSLTFVNVLCCQVLNLWCHVNKWAKQVSFDIVLRCFVFLAWPLSMEFIMLLCYMFLWTDISFHSRTGCLVVGIGGKTQIQTAHIINRNFPSQPFTLGAWFRNLEKCIISFRPQGLFSVGQHWFTEGYKCSSEDSLWLVKRNRFTESGGCSVMCF